MQKIIALDFVMMQYNRQQALQAYANFKPVTGEQLDKLGQLMECSRNEGESDEDYRPRILSTFQNGLTDNA